MGAFKQFLKETENKPKVGMRFKHKRVLSSTDFKSPAEYVVTKVAQGVVYYKQPDERKAKESIGVEDFHKIVKEGVEYIDDPMGGQAKVFVNPSKAQLKSLATKAGEVRILIDTEGNYYAWSAYVASHTELEQELGVRSAPKFLHGGYPMASDAELRKYDYDIRKLPYTHTFA
jgi:hypothetical protein